VRFTGGAVSERGHTGAILAVCGAVVGAGRHSWNWGGEIE
jgi:hypothetical protein